VIHKVPSERAARASSRPWMRRSAAARRWRFWAEIPELEGRYLRVVTLEDKVTIHNAFPDAEVDAHGSSLGHETSVAGFTLKVAARCWHSMPSGRAFVGAGGL
jgi:hypothetical protein